METVNAVEITHLSKKYGTQQIFSDFSVNIPAKQMTAIYGASGSGKSTLLNIMGLIDKPDDGKVTIFNKEIPLPQSGKATKWRRNTINYMFQNFALIEDKSIEYNLNLAKNNKIPKKEFRQKMIEVLQKLNIEHALKTKIYKLSGGEQQRISLARVMLKPGNLVLCDEPTGSVDDDNGEIIIQSLKEIAKDKTVVIVTHDEKVIQNCDNLIKIG